MAYIAQVDTYYTTYALAKTEAKAKRLALESALAWLQQRGAEYEAGKTYTTIEEVEEWLGCRVYKVPMDGAIQEY